MLRRRAVLVLGASAALLGFAMIACGDDDDDTGSPAATSGAVEATSGPRTVGSATPGGGGNDRDPLEAAQRLLDAVACEDEPAQDEPCLREEDIAAPDRGVAAFRLTDPSGVSEVVVLGLTEAGEWQPWLTIENESFHLLRLPGDMIVCADGDGVNVRDDHDPEAETVQALPDQTAVRAEEFVLTEPATDEGSGEGWYRISAPVPGWLHADFVSRADDADCSLRNQQTESSPLPRPSPTATPGGV